MRQALYRAYRPKNFDEVIGQEPITTTLKNEMAKRAPSHAYLFVGSRGTGKTTCAKLVAKAVNCLDLKDGNPCSVCSSCTGVDDGSLLDVSEIDAASNNRVDDIRLLRDEAVFTPSIANYRVYIIDEVHMLSSSAFNALLKTLEEPPPHVIFILATTEIHKLPATIISRCQRFDFQRIESSVAAARLMEIAGLENIGLDEQAAALIASLSDGSMRDSLSLLDVCASAGGNIDTDVVSACAGLTSSSHLWRLFDCVCASDTPGALTVMGELFARGIEPRRLCEQLTGHARALMLAKTVPQAQKIIDCLDEDFARYKDQAERISIDKIISSMTLLQDTAARLSRSLVKRSELELAMVMLCDESLNTPALGLAAQIERLERRIEMLENSGSYTPANRPKAPAKQPSPPRAKPGGRDQDTVAVPAAKSAAKADPPPKTPPPLQSAPQIPHSGALSLFEQWDQVLELLNQTNPAASGLLAGTRAFCSATHVLIEATNPVLLEMLRSNEYTKESIKNAITSATGKKYALGPYRAAEPADEGDPLEAFIASLPKADNIIIE
jgi:DNA polymerase-3 subunit gamma/tau